MTKFHVKTNSATYIRDKEVFLKELKHFHEVRGTAIRHFPVINGKEIDLYLLYMMVTHHGGWMKVNSQGLWDSMLKQLGLPSSCVNGGVAIRQLYLRHLERWERARGGGGGGGGGAGGDMDGGADEGDDDRPRRAAWGTPKPRNTVAHSYNHNQHNVPDHVRESMGLPPLQRFGGSMERLVLSLLSPLPNEQDFALNVCTILAADMNNKLPIHTTPHVIDFLLGHAGVYNHMSLRDVIGKSYKEARHVSADWFWAEHARPTGTLELLDERRFPIQGLAMQAIVSQLSLNSCLLAAEDTDGTLLLPDDKELPALEEIAGTMLGDDEGVLANKCNGGARDLVSRRISQVVTIMRNLSFHEDNLALLAKHQTFLRFILLCVNCSVSPTRQMAMDALGNVAQELCVRDPATCLLSRHVFATLTASLQSDDRARVLGALEVLNKLAQNEANEDVLLRCLEQKVYEQVCSNMTLHDIMLLVVTLECVYALTTLGEKSCDYIVKVHGLVDTLVSLITVEAQSYGPKACILMRVVETVPGGTALGNAPPPRPASPPPPVQQQQQQQQQQQIPQPPIQPPQNPPNQSVQQLQTVSQPPQPSHQPAQPAQQSHQPHQNHQPEQQQTQQSSYVKEVLPPSHTGKLSVQQQHAHQQAIQENEQFALAWLRTTWEPCPANVRLDSGELYKQYMACCQKVGRKGVISPLHFPRCVRSVFGGMVGPTPIKTMNGETQQCYMGIRQRPSTVNKAMIPNVKTGPASPILKAQLSKAEQNKIQMASHPHLSHALGESSAPVPSSSPPPLLQVGQPNQQMAAQQTNHTSPSQVSQLGNQQAGATNTSLIKHLLAHKVSGAPGNAPERMQMQVTQRQNQQRMMGQVPPAPQTPPATQMQNTQVPMELDAEALISCSTITSTGVTSTAPLPPSNVKGPAVPPLAPISRIITSIKQDDPSECVIIETPMQEGNANEDMPANNSNKMLADLLEKRSPPPVPTSQPRHEERKPGRDDENDEPSNKKPRNEGVSSKAANLYAALAADALEDEEDLLLVQNESPVQSTNITPVVQQTQQPGGQGDGHEQEQVRQIIMPTISNQGGQIILHGGSSKVGGNVPGPQYVSHSAPLQLIASPNAQGLSFMQGGVMPHKTIIILQSGNGPNSPITLTVNNPGGLDENTLNNLISQATEAITQQQSQHQSGGNTVIQSTGGIIQTSSGVIQSTQGVIQQSQGIMQGTHNMMHQPGVIKQQILQGQAQLVPSQQPIITHQPQPQIISSNQIISNQQQNQQIIQGSQQIIQGNQQIIQGNQQIIGGNQQVIVQSGNQQQFGQIITSNQQLIGGNQQIVVGNQQIVIGNQQIMTGNVGGTHQIISQGQQFMGGNQQIVSVSQPFQSGNTLVTSSSRFIIEQQGNRQNIVMANQQQGINVNQAIKHEKKIIVNNTQLMQGQKIIVSGQQQFQGNVQAANKMMVNQQVHVNEAQVMKEPPVIPRKIPDEPWVCQWRGCDTVFESAAAVYAHACTAHCNRNELPCMWAHCDQLPRKRFSLMTHLQDRHCSAEALRASLAQRRKGVVPPPAPVSDPRTDSPGPAETQGGQQGVTVGIGGPSYATNAALHAIKRHAVDFLNPRELMNRAEASRSAIETPDDNEGPVTKSIRLTAALILRNIVIYSHIGRRLLRGYEPHLAGIALSSVEASRTVAQVLYDMNCI